MPVTESIVSRSSFRSRRKTSTSASRNVSPTREVRFVFLIFQFTGALTRRFAAPSPASGRGNLVVRVLRPAQRGEEPALSERSESKGGRRPDEGRARSRRLLPRSAHELICVSSSSLRRRGYLLFDRIRPPRLDPTAPRSRRCRDQRVESVVNHLLLFRRSGLEKMEQRDDVSPPREGQHRSKVVPRDRCFELRRCIVEDWRAQTAVRIDRRA